ncbi:MAG: hypothetical protein KDI56_16485, partial [Xanthomonadales bacterium]|nr:hypothetical protein [Xanthomonadales bacterium]
MSRHSSWGRCLLPLLLGCLVSSRTLAAAPSDYHHVGANALVVVVTLLAVVASILLHYNGLDQTWQYLDR